MCNSCHLVNERYDESIPPRNTTQPTADKLTKLLKLPSYSFNSVIWIASHSYALIMIAIIIITIFIMNGIFSHLKTIQDSFFKWNLYFFIKFWVGIRIQRSFSSFFEILPQHKIQSVFFFCIKKILLMQTNRGAFVRQSHWKCVCCLKWKI